MLQLGEEAIKLGAADIVSARRHADDDIFIFRILRFLWLD